jgi:hypothetical protein
MIEDQQCHITLDGFPPQVALDDLLGVQSLSGAQFRQ